MKKLKMTIGSGYREIRNDKGMFAVKYQNYEKVFTSFVEAKKFFDSLNEEKSFWNFTLKPELCEFYEWIEIKEKIKILPIGVKYLKPKKKKVVKKKQPKILYGYNTNK